MRLKPFLPLVVLAMLLTACQTDFHGDDAPAMDNKSLKIKDAKAFFEENRPTTTRTQGNVMSLGISEKCSPDWSEAKESENEHLYCVEVPLKSGFKFISTRKRKLGGKEIYLHQDVLRKLVVLKKKETNEIFMGVMSLVPKVYFTNGEPLTSYDFNHFGDKCGYAGLVIYTNPTGTLVATDFYLKGERILHHHLSKDNPRMDIAKKIIGPVQIYAFESKTRGETLSWDCNFCGHRHSYGDNLELCTCPCIGSNGNGGEDGICAGCLNYLISCTCSYNNACPSCGYDPCQCYYDNCPTCGQNVNYCICEENRCPICGDTFCCTDHQADFEIEQDFVDAGLSNIICDDAELQQSLEEFSRHRIGEIVLTKINQLIEVKLNQEHKGVKVRFDSSGEMYISVGKELSALDKKTGFIEEIIHIAQLCVAGVQKFQSAQLNYEIEAKVMVTFYFGIEGQNFDNTLRGLGYNEFIYKLSDHYYHAGYDDYTNPNNNRTYRFDNWYDKVVDYYRQINDSAYSDPDAYPDNSDYRQFQTFHEDFMRYIKYIIL